MIAHAGTQPGDGARSVAGSLHLALGVVALALMLAASWLAPVAGLAPASPALAAATDLTLVTDTTYTVQPDQGRVRVAMTIVARNNTKETRTRKFYFDHAFLAVLPGASDLKLTGARGASVRVSKRTKDATLLRINLGPRLYSGRSRTLKLTFNLVDKGTASDRSLRVSPSLVTLPVWAHASNGAKGGTVKVRIPAGYDVFVESGSFAERSTTAEGGTELATGTLPNPLSFFAYVSAQKPAVFEDTALTVSIVGGSVPLTLRGWQDDPAWTDRVGGLFERSLPVLREDVGIPWPHDQPLVVQEAISRDAGGYAGLFDPAENRIEVAYWADDLVVLHEAAHGWFNGALLADRWASEGFASLYAERAAAAIELRAAGPSLTDVVAEAAIPLNAWTATPAPVSEGGDSEAARATETYGFAASLALARAIAERAGDDALQGVWADAAGGIGAYQPAAAGTEPVTPPLEVETVDEPPDWRGLLDLLEARTGKDFTDLWREWVVRPDEASLLDARLEARRSYARTLAVAGDWTLPRSIRDAMRAWRFDDAERLLADTRTVLAQRGALASMAERDGLALSGEMEARFEAGDLAQASGWAEAERNAMLAISQAEATRTAEQDPLTAMGMIGENPEADVRNARAALAEGDLEATLAFADDAHRAWTGAWQEGRRRALLAVAVIATLIVLVTAVAGRLRADRRERHAFATAAAHAGGGTPAAAAVDRDPSADRDPSPEELLDAAAPFAITGMPPAVASPGTPPAPGAPRPDEHPRA